MCLGKIQFVYYVLQISVGFYGYNFFIMYLSQK